MIADYLANTGIRFPKFWRRVVYQIRCTSIKLPFARVRVSTTIENLVPNLLLNNFPENPNTVISMNQVNGRIWILNDTF